MPSSVRVGSRPPSSCLILLNSSGVRPCSRIISGVMAIGVIAEVVIGNLYCRISTNFSHANSYQVYVERTLLSAAFDVDPELEVKINPRSKAAAKSTRPTHVYTVADEVRNRRHRRTY